MQIFDYREQLRIQAVSIMKLEYYQYMSDLYTGLIDPKATQLPPKPSRPAMDLSSQETKNKIIEMFAQGKQGMGYGK